MERNLKNKTVSGTLWSLVERVGVQGVTFLVQLVMARLLLPEDYGLVGMLTIFIVVAQSLVDAGFTQGLIRKGDLSATDTSTVFYFNIVASLLLYGVLYSVAPLIAEFYNIPLLTPLTRVLSLGIVINSLAMVQRAVFTIQLNFKTQAKASFIASVLSGAAGIYMAVMGLGVWTLVWYQLLNYLLATIFMWIVSSWRPKRIFDFRSFRELGAFGFNIACSLVIDNIYRNIYLLVIGKFFRPATLGFYTRAQQFGEMPMNISGIIQRVSFPVLCKVKDEDDALVKMTLKFLRVSAFFTFPFMMGMAGVAKPMIVCFLGEKWAFSSLLLQIICFGLMWYPVSVLNQNMLQVKGKGGRFLQMEIVKKIVGVGIICVTLPFGLVPLCVGQSVNWMAIIVINALYTRSVMPLGLMIQLKALLPIYICSVIMGGLTWGVTTLFESVVLQLVAGTASGILIYIVFSYLFLREDLREAIAIFSRKKR